MTLQPPFPWFGGKSRVAPIVWQRFGDVDNYVEPFLGSGAVLFGRPTTPRIETVNDLDCYVSNFWRAVASDPEQVAQNADWPVNEADLHARHLWLVGQAEFRERMHSDPEFYDVKIAGWWVWGICQWIGSGWCAEDCYYDASAQLPHLGDPGRGIHRPSAQLPHLGDPGMGIHRPSAQLPHLGNPGMGIHRPSAKLPHLGDPGMGIHRPSAKLPHLGNPGMGIHRPSAKLPHLGDPGRGIHRPSAKLPHLGDPGRGLVEYMERIAARLRSVRVCCGDWSRVLGPSPTTKNGMTGVFLDPPYVDKDRAALYAVESYTVGHDVRNWAIEHGDDPQLRIALCGYEPMTMPDGWSKHAWKAAGGFASQGKVNGRQNCRRELIWFSPACLPDGRLL